MKRLILIAVSMLALTSCSNTVSLTMTREEAGLINESPDVMRILSIDNEADLFMLRRSSTNFNVPDLNTAEYRSLADKMVSTLKSTEGGVGLAAPQVGLNRRIVVVKRVDKEGEPLEVYPNIRIEEFRGEKKEGPEGCLSVPDQRGNVLRYNDITIVYTDVNSDRMDQPREIREEVNGFAAVIFQHEVDHLEGVLFIDKMQN